MKASKLPSGNWRVNAYRDGKRKSFTAKHKQDAILMAAAWKNEKDPRIPHHGDLIDAVEAYIDAKEAVLSPSTIRAYRMYARSITWDIPLGEITSEEMQQVVNELARTKSPKTVKNIHSLMKAAVSFADPTITWKVTLPKGRIRQSTIPTDEVVKELIRKANPDLRKAILLGAMGGLRRGEICGLTYGDIIRSHNMVHIHCDVVRNIENEYVRKEIPKNATSDRYVELPEEVIEMLGNGPQSDVIVKMVPHSITTGFMRLTASCGVSVRFHDLRHYSASVMHAIGVPDQYIMARHGWKSDTTLKAVYRETLEDKKNSFTDKTNQYMKTLLVNEP